MKTLLGFLGICLISCVTLVQPANIVFYFGISSYSHRIAVWPFVSALADKGHNVTFISPYPTKNPNPKVRDFISIKLKEWVESWGQNVFESRANKKQFEDWILLPQFGKKGCDVIYTDEDLVQLIKESQVDLLFVDALVNECAYGWAAYWNAKVILFTTATLTSWHTEPFGIPDETSWIPSTELFYPLPMTFMQRMKNAITPVAWDIYRRWDYFPYLEQLTSKSLNMSGISFDEIERSIPVVFANTHYSEEFARSMPPNVIPVGGMAIVDKKKSLPLEMDNFLKNGSQFIYVSFGTYADFNLMPVSSQEALVGTMNAFPEVQFIWKVDNDTVINEISSGNVFISKWMPQQEILAHPKIKAFITHAGLLGTQEAIQNSVPLISFPIFAEQDYNAERIHRNKYGVQLEILTVTQPELEDAVRKVLSDSVYRKNAQRVSTLFKDRPQKPLETALWWTEFVLRRSPEELASLRPMSSRQPWWVKRQLDVWLVLSAIVLVALSAFILIIFKCVQDCTSVSKPEQFGKLKVQ